MLWLFILPPNPNISQSNFATGDGYVKSLSRCSQAQHTGQERLYVTRNLPSRPVVGSWRSTTKRQHCFWRSPHADNTSRDSRSQVAGLQSLWDRFLEHAVLVDGGHPVGVGGGVVVAAAVPVALDERPRAEVLQTRPWRRKGLTCSIRTGVGVLRKIESIGKSTYCWLFNAYHDKAVAFPEVIPVLRTLRHIHVLRVHRHCFSRGLADGAF